METKTMKVEGERKNHGNARAENGKKSHKKVERWESVGSCQWEKGEYKSGAINAEHGKRRRLGRYPPTQNVISVEMVNLNRRGKRTEDTAVNKSEPSKQPSGDTANHDSGRGKRHLWDSAVESSGPSRSKRPSRSSGESAVDKSEAMVQKVCNTNEAIQQAVLVEKKSPVFVEGLSTESVGYFQRLAERKGVNVCFMTEFSDDVDVYVVDYASGSGDPVLLRTCRFYRAIGLSMNILHRSFLKQLKKANGNLPIMNDHRVTSLEKTRAEKGKLFQKYRFLMIDSISWEEHTFSRSQVARILCASGGLVECHDWSLLWKRRIGFNLQNKKLESEGVETFVVSWRLGENENNFNDVYRVFGVKTVNISYLLDCIEAQEVLRLQNDDILYQTTGQNDDSFIRIK